MKQIAFFVRWIRKASRAFIAFDVDGKLWQLLWNGCVIAGNRGIYLGDLLAEDFAVRTQQQHRLQERNKNATMWFPIVDCTLSEWAFRPCVEANFIIIAAQFVVWWRFIRSSGFDSGLVDFYFIWQTHDREFMTHSHSRFWLLSSPASLSDDSILKTVVMFPIDCPPRVVPIQKILLSPVGKMVGIKSVRYEMFFTARTWGNFLYYSKTLRDRHLPSKDNRGPNQERMHSVKLHSEKCKLHAETFIHQCHPKRGFSTENFWLTFRSRYVSWLMLSVLLNNL